MPGGTGLAGEGGGGGQDGRLLSPLHHRVELVEALGDDGDGKADDEDAENGADHADQAAPLCEGDQVAVTNLRIYIMINDDNVVN